MSQRLPSPICNMGQGVVPTPQGCLEEDGPCQQWGVGQGHAQEGGEVLGGRAEATHPITCRALN